MSRPDADQARAVLTGAGLPGPVADLCVDTDDGSSGRPTATLAAAVPAALAG